MANLLRYHADNYRQVQKLRIGVGERIRAALQNRDWTEIRVVPDDEAEPETTDDIVEAMLNQIMLGHAPGPVPTLGRSYHRYWTEERDTYKEMEAAMDEHPAWPWLKNIKGIGPTLACKILASLDINKAKSAAAFWRYAGLSTQVGMGYRCSVCSLERAFPANYTVTGTHKAAGTQKTCKGLLAPFGEAGVATPPNKRGEPRGHDSDMKKTMYLVGVSFERFREGSYGKLYRKYRTQCEEKHPFWPPAKKRYWAMRKVEKLFLSHLWQVWREALGMPVGEPYAFAILGHDPIGRIDPWEMVEPEKKKVSGGK